MPEKPHAVNVPKGMTHGNDRAGAHRMIQGSKIRKAYFKLYFMICSCR